MRRFKHLRELPVGQRLSPRPAQNVQVERILLGSDIEQAARHQASGPPFAFMATGKQIAANRRNAQLSTGPRMP
jgi:hypothetical protein